MQSLQRIRVGLATCVILGTCIVILGGDLLAAPPGDEAALDAGEAADPAAPPETGPRRMAALLLRTGDVDPGLADALTELVISTLAAGGRYHLVGKEEVKTALGVHDELEALECIISTPCLAALASALDVSFALVGSIGMGKDKAYILTITLVNLVTGETENRFFAKVRGGLKEVSERLAAITPEVATPRPKPGIVRVSASVRGSTLFSLSGATVYIDDVLAGEVPVAKADVGPGEHIVRVVRPGYRVWTASVPVVAGEETTVAAELEVDPLYVPARRPKRGIATLTWISAGMAALTAGGGLVLGLIAKGAEGAANIRGITRASFDSARTGAHDAARTANVLFGVSGAFALFSGYFFIFQTKNVFGSAGRSSDDGEDEKRKPEKKAGADGLGVGVGVRF